MRRILTGTAAAAALATALAIPVAFAQETQQGKQAPANMGSGQHRQTGQGQMGERAGQPGAQAQKDQSRMGAEPSQGQNSREREQAGTPGMKGESAQTQNRAQAQTGPQGEERRLEPPRGTGAQVQERTGQAGTRSEQTEPKANLNQMGQAQNRENAPQTGQSGRRMTGQNVQTKGKAHLGQDKAAQIAQTLRTSGNTQTSPNINTNNVAIGADLPGAVVISPLPPAIVELVPEFRGYDYFVFGDEVVIVDPATRQVVEIIEDVG